MLKLASVRFERVKERLYGFVRVEERTVADTSWFISVRFFLLRSGESPGDGSYAWYTTHVEPRGYPATRRGEIQVCNAPWDYAAGIRRVECEIRRHDQYRPELSVHFPVSDTADAGAENRDEALKAAPEVQAVPGKRNAVEGSLEFNMPILLPVGLCSPRSVLTDGSARPHPIVFQYPCLEIHETEGRLDADLHLRYESWPKTKWILAVELLDAAGTNLVRAETSQENSGSIAKFPWTEETTIHLDLGKRSDPTNAKRFRFSIESVWTEQGNPFRFGEKVPLSLELNGIEYSKMLAAESLMLVKLNGDARATIHVKHLSGPKTAWRLGVRVFNEEGQEVGSGQSLLENDGTIRTQPLEMSKDVEMLLKGAWDAVSRAKRYAVTLERVSRTSVQQQADDQDPLRLRLRVYTPTLEGYPANAQVWRGIGRGIHPYSGDSGVHPPPSAL